MLRTIALGIAAVAVAAPMSGCLTTDALFVGTYTRIGVDASRDGVGGGIGFKNVALTAAPTRGDGSAYDVMGSTDTDLSFTNLVMSEIVATGEAAVCASGKGSAHDFKTTGKGKSTSPLIFAAVSTFSLVEISLGEAEGPGVSFGYRRTVGIRMPIKNEQLGSSFSSVSINTTADNATGADPTKISGTRSVFKFATGEAAVNMAQKYPDKVTGISGHRGCQD